jgi:ribosomal protein S18 acetylase RimI-like enzyme
MILGLFKNLFYYYSMSVIRPLNSADKDFWFPLWHGYLEFYKTELSNEQTELTWKRLLDSDFNLYGLVVEVDGVIQGITHYSFQNSTWAPKNYCYLEDLFTSPAMRGKGLGRALIDAVKEIAINEGSSRLYWTTDKDNVTARKLYDSYSLESGKVQYRIPLDATD